MRTKLNMSSSSRLGIAEIVDTSDRTRDNLRKLAATIYRDKLAADLKPLVDHDKLPVAHDILPSLAELQSKIDLQEVLLAIARSVPDEAYQCIVHEAMEKHEVKLSAKVARQLDERGEAEPIEWEQERRKQRRVMRATKQLADT